MEPSSFGRIKGLGGLFCLDSSQLVEAAFIMLSPEPKKDDPRFSGDYNAFRKAYKAWNARAAYVKKARAACQQQDEAGLHAKPAGKAPAVDGVECMWDAESGCWRTEGGVAHDPSKKRKAEKEAFFAAKKVDDAAVQQQRRADCARINAAALAQAVPEQAAWVPEQAHRPDYFVSKTVNASLYAPFNPRVIWPYHDVGSSSVTVPGGEDFLARLNELNVGAASTSVPRWPAISPWATTSTACGSTRSTEARFFRSDAYWRRVSALLEADSCMSHEQFNHHLSELLTERLEQLCREREQEVCSYTERLQAEHHARMREDNERRRLENLRRENLRLENLAALQQSALARSSEPGSVVVKATPRVRPAQDRRGNVARNWQEGEFRVYLKLEAFTVG